MHTDSEETNSTKEFRDKKNTTIQKRKYKKNLSGTVAFLVVVVVSLDLNAASLYLISSKNNIYCTLKLTKEESHIK